MNDTRTQILERIYQAVRLHGFQGMRADKVVIDLGITKGALYHYFASKLELGYAIVDERPGGPLSKPPNATLTRWWPAFRVLVNASMKKKPGWETRSTT